MNSSSSLESNSTKTTTTTSNTRLQMVFENLSNIATCFSLLIHLAYYVLIALSKSLRKRTFLYANHANVVSSFYLLTSLAYIPAQYPNLNDPLVYRILCPMGEILWMFTGYIRFYSIVLIAFYRSLAVFRPHYYTRLTRSYPLLLAPIALAWLLSFALPLVAKHAFNTGFSPKLCLGGFSTSARDTWSYFVFNYTLMTLLPAVFTFLIYVLISRRLMLTSAMSNSSDKCKNLTNMSLELSQNNKSSCGGGTFAPIKHQQIQMASIAIIVVKSSSASKFGLVNGGRGKKGRNKELDDVVVLDEAAMQRREKKFADQFLFMCVFTLLIAIGLSIFQLRNVIPDYYVSWTVYAKVIKTLMVVCMAGVPVTSICFHPDRERFARRVKSKVFPTF